MCGINCVVSQTRQAKVREMNEVISHRGPDQCGVFENEEIGLGLARLSILDPTERGKQPMEFGNVVISYNGEVYNFQTLRSHLEAEGYEFVSGTDTEVILKGYDAEGPAFFERLNGMASVVIYDRTAKKVVLFRDRIGIKPLYYFRPQRKELVVSSEIKPITQTFDTSFTIDGRAVSSYFESRTVTGESFFREVNAVRPGECLTFDLTTWTAEREQLVDIYDAIDPEAYKQKQKTSETALVDKLDRCLNEAVERQMVSDVPLATICSGGLDSSLLTAIAAQYTDNLNVYHVSVDHPELSETTYAEQVADHLDLELTTTTLDATAYNNLLNDCLYYNDVPFVHVNSVGMSQVFERVQADGVKVLLTGEGADELFGGYGRYLGFYYGSLINKFNPIRPLLNALPRKEQLPFAFLNSAENVQNNFLTDQYNLSGEDSWIADERRELFETLCKRYECIGRRSRRNSTAYMLSELRHFLPPLLQRTDRMSMMSSVEARVPYLDNEVADFALNLPHKYKINHLETKYLLKKVAERYLPEQIVYRDKQGFHLPISEWLDSSTYQIRDDRHFKSEFYERWVSSYEHAF
jgi:asparagine synthase (glutamine-hydrolysing)